MTNILLKLKYDGTNYCGWQRQANGVTIQGALERRLSELCGEKIAVTGCSRTDSGVHARAYVCNFHTQSELPPHIIKRALNAALPKDIAILAAHYVNDDFNSRYYVKSKTYVYQIWNAEERDPFLQRYAYHIKTPLDIAAMNDAAARFIGEHDFRAFTTAEGATKNTIRTITDCRAEKSGELIMLTVAGQSFLHNQVRIIAGTLIKVGQGKLPPGDIPRIIASGKRELAGATAPALGLFLGHIDID